MGNSVPQSTEFPAPWPPLRLSQEDDVYVFVKKIRNTDDLRIVVHHIACFMADLSMRHASINLHHSFVVFYSPDYKNSKNDTLDEVWIPWKGIF